MADGATLKTLERESGQREVLLHLHFSCERVAIAAALASASDALGALHLSVSDCAANEIVLAEAVNNIAEHAYQEKIGGPIELILTKDASHIYCDLRDKGVCMPNDRVPSAKVHKLDGSVESLPEGGFGWDLIHKLVSNVFYRRQNAENQLTYSIVIN